MWRSTHQQLKISRFVELLGTRIDARKFSRSRSPFRSFRFSVPLIGYNHGDVNTTCEVLDNSSRHTVRHSFMDVFHLNIFPSWIVLSSSHWRHAHKSLSQGQHRNRDNLSLSVRRNRNQDYSGAAQPRPHRPLHLGGGGSLPPHPLHIWSRSPASRFKINQSGGWIPLLSVN